jgi:hypothetical protein
MEASLPSSSSRHAPIRKLWVVPASRLVAGLRPPQIELTSLVSSRFSMNVWPAEHSGRGACRQRRRASNAALVTAAAMANQSVRVQSHR